MENKNNYNLFKILSAILILILIITFSIQNNTNTVVKLWFWSADSPLILLFLTCFIAGVLFTTLGIFSLYQNSRRKSKLIEELKERIELLEKKNIDNQKN